MKEFNIKKRNLAIALCCAFVVMICAILMFRCSISHKEEYTLHYNDYSKLDYNVYLKDNQFYDVPFLPKDNVYISTLIDYIDANFNYNFNVVEDISLGYDYYISAKLIIGENNDKKIYESEEMLLDKKEIQEVKNGIFSIDEKVKIDYNKYNTLANTFLKKYGLATNANLIVSMYVDISGTYEKFEKKLNDSAVVSLEIPLTTNTTEIAINYDLKNSVNEKFEYGKTSITKVWLFILALLVAIIDIIFVIIKLIVYVNSKDYKEMYQERLNKIFSEYGSYISKKLMTVKTKEIMYTVSLRVEMLDSFEDLINVRDSIERPILFYESEPGEQAIFYIIDIKVSYIYVLNAKDCAKNNIFGKFINTKDKITINDIKVANESNTDNDLKLIEEIKDTKKDDVYKIDDKDIEELNKKIKVEDVTRKDDSSIEEASLDIEKILENESYLERRLRESKTPKDKVEANKVEVVEEKKEVEVEHKIDKSTKRSRSRRRKKKNSNSSNNTSNK